MAPLSSFNCQASGRHSLSLVPATMRATESNDNCVSGATTLDECEGEKRLRMEMGQTGGEDSGNSLIN